MTIINKGTESDNYKIRVTSDLGWPFELSHEEVMVSAGHMEEVTIIVKAPEVNILTRDDFTVTVSGMGVRDSEVFYLVVEGI